MSKEVSQAALGQLNAELPILKPGEQVSIPATTPSHYITGIPALNLPAPEGTSGDWHFYTVFYKVTNTNKPVLRLQLAGDGEVVNTNRIYGQYGVYECSKAMKEVGLDLPEGMAHVYAANHFRAILDMLYRSLIRHHKVIALAGATEDWLDSQEQKEFLLEKAGKMLPFLDKGQQANLRKWINQERPPGYRS